MQRCATFLAVAALWLVGCGSGHSGARDAASTSGGLEDAPGATLADGSSAPEGGSPRDATDAPAAPDAVSSDAARDAAGGDVSADASPPRPDGVLYDQGPAADASTADRPPPRATGSPCDRATDCVSGFCVDGVCCGTRRCGICESCALAGSAGTCRPVRSAGDSDSCSMCDSNGVCQSRAIRVSPLAFDFADTQAGKASSETIFTVTNATGAPKMLLISTRDDDDGNFTIVNDTCNKMTIADGATCRIVVKFTPQFAGAKTAYLVISNQGGDNILVELTGTGT